MREYKWGRSVKKVDTTNSGIIWDGIPAVHRANQLDFTPRIHSYDGSTWTDRTFITYKEFTHSLTIIFISATAFGTGIGAIIFRLFGY